MRRTLDFEGLKEMLDSLPPAPEPVEIWVSMWIEPDKIYDIPANHSLFQKRTFIIGADKWLEVEATTKPAELKDLFLGIPVNFAPHHWRPKKRSSQT